jgi:ABC-type Fe3+-hydroxamate transport system substrate-binding protein
VGAICILILLVTGLGGCNRTNPRNVSTTQPSGKITVASLVPAASDLLLGMGAGDRLVAISNFDLPDARTKNLPRVGDYQTFDWEKLAGIKPNAMIVQFDADRIPPGLQQRADSLGIKLVNIHNNRLADVFKTIDQLGEALHLESEAKEASAELKSRIEGVARQVEGLPRVRTLIVTDSEAHYAVGPNNFIDDVLKAAGGTNVMAGNGKPYPQIDAEMLRSLKPAVIIVLLPGAAPHQVDQAKATLARMTDLPAVQNKRVYVLTDPWLLLPGWHVADMAEVFASLLHKEIKMAPLAPSTDASVTDKALR